MSVCAVRDELQQLSDSDHADKQAGLVLDTFSAS